MLSKRILEMSVGYTEREKDSMPELVNDRKRRARASLGEALVGLLESLGKEAYVSVYWDAPRLLEFGATVETLHADISFPGSAEG